MPNFDEELKSLLAAGRHGDVIERYESRPAGSPATPELQNIYACALIMAGKFAGAFDILKAVPDTQKTPNIWNNLLLAGLQLERFDETLRLADDAVRAYPKVSSFFLAKTRCHAALNQPEDAYDAARAALEATESDETYCAAGLAAEQCRKYDDAIALYRGALRLNPTHGAAANNLNDLCWRARRFSGLRELAEARLNSPTNRAQYAPYFAAPCAAWTDGSLQGRRLHVIADQGVGDQIMFTQFLKRLGEFRPAGVVVQMEPRLVPLFREGYGGDVDLTFEPFGATVEFQPTDAKVALSSLPNFLVRSTDDFARTPFLSLAPGDADLRGGDGRPVYGLSWWSAGLASDTRNLDVEELADALLTTDARFLSLQYRPADAGIDRLKARLGDRLIVAEGLDCTDDFLGVARTCLRLDGILTIPQALVHVAGAVGAPTGVLLPPNPSWRYDSPDERMLWYGDHVRLISYDEGKSLEDRIDSFTGRGTR